MTRSLFAPWNHFDALIMGRFLTGPCFQVRCDALYVVFLSLSLLRSEALFRFRGSWCFRLPCSLELLCAGLRRWTGVLTRCDVFDS